MADLEKKLIDKGLTLSPLAVSYVYTMYSTCIYMYIVHVQTHHPSSQGWASRCLEHLMSICKVFVCLGLVVLLLGCIGVLTLCV